MGYIEQVLAALEARYGAKYAVARMVIEDVKEWIKRDVNFSHFLEKDRVFREQNHGFTAAGFDYRMYVPRSKGPASKYFMREEFVDGENLTQWETLERDGHDMKQIISLIVKNYVQQLRRGHAHSDVHVGNFRVTKDRRIAILDRNFFLELTPEMQAVVNLFLNPLALATMAPEAVIDQLITVAQAKMSAQDRTALATSWLKTRSQILQGDWRSISHFLVDLRKHGLRLPLEVTLIFKNLNALQQMSQEAGFHNLVEAYLYTPPATSISSPAGPAAGAPQPDTRRTLQQDTRGAQETWDDN